MFEQLKGLLNVGDVDMTKAVLRQKTMIENMFKQKGSKTILEYDVQKEESKHRVSGEMCLKNEERAARFLEAKDD